MIAAGVASPIAQGQATISTPAAMMKAAASAPSGGCAAQSSGASESCTRRAQSGASPQLNPAASATPTTSGTKTLLTRSPSRWMLARLAWARCTAAIMCARAVSSPVAVTRISNRPLRLTVPAYSRLPGALSTGADSPVSMDSSRTELPSSAAPSVGTRSPGRRTTRSPSRNSATGTSRSAPSGSRRRASAGARFSNWRRALDARALTRDSSQCPTLTTVMIAAASMK